MTHPADKTFVAQKSCCTSSGSGNDQVTTYSYLRARIAAAHERDAAPPHLPGALGRGRPGAEPDVR
eukprot:1406899-Pleurochrysis_carterae.AAC.1